MHVLAVLWRNEFDARGAMGHHEEIAVVDEIAERSFDKAGSKPDIVPTLCEKRRAQHGVVVLKCFDKAGFSEEFVIAFTEEARLDIVGKQFLGEMKLKRNVKLDVLAEVVIQVANFHFKCGVVLVPEGGKHGLLNILQVLVKGACKECGLSQFENFFQPFFRDAMCMLCICGQVVHFEFIADVKLVLNVKVKKEDDAKDDEKS